MNPPAQLEDIDTPAVAIDLGRAQSNIAKLQGYLDEHGLANRPHIKTHKLPFFAHMQVAAGAPGITVQTVGEAEVMAAAGLKDLLLTYDVIGERKARRLAGVARTVDHLRVAVDNEVALTTVMRAAELAERTIGVLVEFESGKKRQGVLEPGAALTLARLARSGRFTTFLGLLTYPCGPQAGAFIAAAEGLFAAEGVPLAVISAGGTPNMWRAHEVPGLTEYRAGTSIYHDRRSVGSGSATFDECALHVHVTLVSRPTADRGVIDAGSKVLTSDTVPESIGRGYGHILEYPDAVITELSEEHGAVDFSGCLKRPRIGERLRVIPNHVCPVSNLVDDVVIHQEGRVMALMPVSARGKR
ncbi:MAG TPA: alanine racemase [Trueperaceae bacterium]|nr:alanine racemase [Trueperaceae bacterium]